MSLKAIYVISDTPSALPEMCSGAKTLADKVTAITFGDRTAAEEAAICGADALIYCPVNPEGSPEDYSEAIAAEIKKEDSAYVFVSNTIIGRCLAGKLGVYLDTAVFSNVGELAADDTLSFSRSVYGGTADRRIAFSGGYGVVTLNAGAFDSGEPLPATTDISEIEGVPAVSLKRISTDEKHETAVNIAVAKRIVDIGRGLAKEEDLDLIRKLASVIGAEIGCSRPVAENNKSLPKNIYLGITGVQVKPDVIISIGISGQIQHIGGINKSKLIVAVNKDKSAPIFKNADFGLVGDLYKVVPKLIEKLS